MHKKTIFILGLVLIGLSLITIFVVKQSVQISVKPSEKPIVESEPLYLPTQESDPMYGNPGSAVTIDEFFGFNCPDCTILHEQLVSFANNHSDKIRLRSTGILKINWLGQQEDALPALALACAEKQNTYWQFLDKLFKLSNLKESSLKELAKELKLNESQFDNCLKDQIVSELVQAKQTALQNSGLSETPLLFVNNKKINLTDDLEITEILNTIIKQ